MNGPRYCHKEANTVKNFAVVMDAIGFGSSSERHLFIEMAWRADSKGNLRQTQTELARSTLLSLRTVKRLMVEFQDRGVMERMGHGRYKLVVDEDFEGLITPPRTMPKVTGAEAETARLRAVMTEDEGIVYKDGWPVLVKMSRYMSDETPD
jgi:hypothetical protein